MNPLDELLQDLDPMPGEEDAGETAPDVPDVPDETHEESEAPQLDPRERQALVQQMVLEDPELKSVFMAGLAAMNQPRQEQEQADPRALIEGDPGLEYLASEIQAIKAERDQARLETQAVQSLGQFIAVNDVPDDIAREMMAMPSLGLAIAQDQQFAGLMTKLVKSAGGVRKHTEAVASSAKPPATVGQASAMAGDPGLDAKAMNLKKSLGSDRAYRNFTDADWKDLAKD